MLSQRIRQSKMTVWNMPLPDEERHLTEMHSMAYAIGCSVVDTLTAGQGNAQLNLAKQGSQLGSFLSAGLQAAREM